MEARYVSTELTPVAHLHTTPRLSPLAPPRDDASLPPLGVSRTDMPVAIYDIAKLHAANCTVFEGKVYNGKGHPICGVLNQHDKPCHRIGRCPFHYYSSPVSPDNVCNGAVDAAGTAVPDPAARLYPDDPAPTTPPKKMQYKHGWTKEEHYLFLYGLRTHGRGAWKQIALDVKTRTPTQVQSHAQKFYLRQKQKNKNKRSIHDLTLESPEMGEIEKQLALHAPPAPPASRAAAAAAAAHGALLPADEFGAMLASSSLSSSHTDPRAHHFNAITAYKDERTAAHFPLSFRPGLTAARAPVAAVHAPWYAPLDKAATPYAAAPRDHTRNEHSWPEVHKGNAAFTTTAMESNGRYDDHKRALLEAAPLRASDSLLYAPSTVYGNTHYHEAPNTFESPSTSVYLATDGVADMLSGVSKGIVKPAHRPPYGARTRAWPPTRAKSPALLPDGPPFEGLPHAPLPPAFLAELHEPDTLQQPPRDVAALLARNDRWKRER